MFFVPPPAGAGEFRSVTAGVDTRGVVVTGQPRWRRSRARDVMDIERHVFLPQMLTGLGMFRLPLPRAGWTYTTDECAAIFEDDRSGVVLKPVWSAQVDCSERLSESASPFFKS